MLSKCHLTKDLQIYFFLNLCKCYNVICFNNLALLLQNEFVLGGGLICNVFNLSSDDNANMNLGIARL